MFKMHVSRLIPAIAVVVASSSAMGLSIRDDLTFAPYETQVNTSPYAAAGQFNNGQSGTLIGSTWVLGCAHLSVDPTSFTASDGTTRSVVQSIYFPGSGDPANATSGNDFALFELSAPINTVPKASLHDPIASGVDYNALLGQIVNETAVYTAAGETGDGATGVPFTQSGTRDILAGTNVIDSTGANFGAGVIANIAVSDFDDPDTFGPDNDPGTSLEMGLARRDSGGGLWVDLGDGPVLIGVHSTISDPDEDDVFGEYGQQNFSTVLTPTAYNWVQATIPEPSSMMLLFASGALLLRRRR